MYNAFKIKILTNKIYQKISPIRRWSKLFDVAVATKIDRFSRSIADFYNFSKRLSDLGVDVVSATQQVDTTTSGGKFMLAIFLAFAEFERNIISERTKEIITKKGENRAINYS